MNAFLHRLLETGVHSTLEPRLMRVAHPQLPPTTEETVSTIPHQIPFHQRDAEELLTLAETAEILRVPINTVRWWRQIGSGPEFFKIGRHLVTTVGDVRRYIREQRRGQRPVLN
jgi:hypothetical protein